MSNERKMLPVVVSVAVEEGCEVRITLHGDVAGSLTPHAEAQALVDRLTAERDALQSAAAQRLMSETLMTGMHAGPGGLTLELEGGAAQLLAECIAKQYAESEAVNYLELTFTSQHVIPGERFIVTVQRASGETPHQLRAKAEAERDAALEDAKRLREALQRLERAVDLFVGRSAWTQTTHLKGLQYSKDVRSELFAAHDEARAALAATGEPT